MKKTLLAGLITGFCILGLTHSASATPYTGSDIELLGTQFSNSSGFDTTNTPESGEKLWYSTSENAVWTAWSGLWMEYSADLTEGNWNIGLNVTNHGDIGTTGWYTQFEITNNLTNSVIEIPASDTETNFGFINYDVTLATAGNYTVRYTWLNDLCDDGLDANIQIDNVFFDNTATVPVPEPATMLLFGTGLIGLVGYRRRKNANV